MRPGECYYDYSTDNAETATVVQVFDDRREQNLMYAIITANSYGVSVNLIKPDMDMEQTREFINGMSYANMMHIRFRERHLHDIRRSAKVNPRIRTRR